jgi:hypothetical protein
MRLSWYSAATLLSLGWLAGPALAETKFLDAEHRAAELVVADDASHPDQALSPLQSASDQDPRWIGMSNLGPQWKNAEPQDVIGDSDFTLVEHAQSSETVPAAPAVPDSLSGSPSGDCCPAPCCVPCIPCYPKFGFFGDYLLLRARNGDVAYAQPRSGLGANAVPVGPVGQVNPTYQSGFRIGGQLFCDPYSAIVTTFAWWESQNSSTLMTDVPNSIHSLVQYPNTASARSTSLFSDGALGIRFRTADVVYRRYFYGNAYGNNLNFQAGLRYGHLGQNFDSDQQIVPGITNTNSRIKFDGAGLNFGLNGQQRCWNSGFMVYGSTGASFLAGSWRAQYQQNNTFLLREAATQWKDDRIVPILEAELGIGWISRTGNIRLTSGYYMATWFNAVTTGQWINGVQNNNFTNIGGSIAFDGLASRLQFLF